MDDKSIEFQRTKSRALYVLHCKYGISPRKISASPEELASVMAQFAAGEVVAALAIAERNAPKKVARLHEAMAAIKQYLSETDC